MPDISTEIYRDAWAMHKNKEPFWSKVKGQFRQAFHLFHLKSYFFGYSLLFSPTNYPLKNWEELSAAYYQSCFIEPISWQDYSENRNKVLSAN